MTTGLLSTKLHVPQTRPELVPRSRLITRLNEVFHCRLALVSAPAGFGKTTLLSEWATRIRRPVAWVSLDDGDNDPTRFWSYFIAALQRIQANVGEATLTALQSSRPVPLEPLLVDLINDINGMPDPFVVVLDDFHVIVSQRVCDALAFLLSNSPPQMHLVVATRADPPLPLERLRGRGQLNELRAADLCFTVDETAAFLNQVMGLDLSVENIAALEARTEGWIAGLQMAALSMRGQDRERVTSFIAGFTGSHRHVLHYLVEEVLQRQPERVQTFLLQTAILDRLSGPLCDAVTGQREAREMLRALERSNLFIVPLDNDQRWYRYHHLFADLLRARLEQRQPGQVPVLHRRASAWYEQSDLIAEAVHHALAAGDIDRVAQLVVRNVLAVMGHGQLTTVERWLAALPDEEKRSRPSLCIAWSCVLVQTGQLAAAESLLRDAEQALQLDAAETGIDERLTGYIAAVRAYAAHLRRDAPRALQLTREALERLPADDFAARRWVMSEYAAALYWTGDAVAAEQAFAETNGIPESAIDAFAAVTSLCELAVTQAAQGQLRKAAGTYRAAIRLGEDHAGRVGRRLPVIGYAHIKLAWLLREWNDLESAMKHMREGVKISREWGQPHQLVVGCINLARLLHTVGDVEGALEVIREGRRVAARLSSRHVTQLDAREACIRLREGDLSAGSRWVRESDADFDGPIQPGNVDLYPFMVEILIAQGRGDPTAPELDRALRLSGRLLESAEAAGWGYWVILALILQAMALQAQGEMERALVSLERALVLSEPEGSIRIFIDMGAPMGELLRRAAARGVAVAYVGRLLAALEAEGAREEMPGVAVPRAQLVEPLSKRELEVVRLLAAGLSNKEIADTLVISVSTAKKHLQNVYGKLNVHRRTQAVDRARDLGLL